MTPLFSRRRFCLSAALGPLLFASNAHAQEPPTSNADLPAPTLQAIGARMLREGRTFEKAAEQFRQATRKAPSEPGHFLGLGCALASRAASLAHAAAFRSMLADERATYMERVKEWEKARDDFKAENPQAFASINYDQFKPKLPADRTFSTKDDNTRFTLTDAQTVETLAALSRQAQSAWEKGVGLCKTDADKAQAYYIQAWGLRVLHEYAFPTPLPPAPQPAGKAATPGLLEAAVKAADQAVALAPENPLYRQAVGDLCWDGEPERARLAYQKAVELAPRNRNVLYFLYRDAVGKELHALYSPPNNDTGTAGKTRTPPPEPFSVPLGYLRRAQAGDRTNAWPQYEEAAILFRLAPYSIVGPSGNPNATPKAKQAALDAVLNDAARTRGKRAIDLLVQGNLQPHDNVPRYEQSVPNLLAAAWSYNALMRDFALTLGSPANIRELARSVIGYAQVMAQKENNGAEAVRANRAALGMGMRLIGDWPTTDDPKTGHNLSEPLVGMAIVLHGLQGPDPNLSGVERHSGSRGRAKRKRRVSHTIRGVSKSHYVRPQ